MIEVLPIRLLTDEDALLFGSLNVSLAKLHRNGLETGPGLVITPPDLTLKTTLEHFNFGSKESFEQTLTLIKKEIQKIPVPQTLHLELGKHKQFLLNGTKINSSKELWLSLLNIWLEQIKNRLWQKGFYQGITQDLEVQIIIFINSLESFGNAFFDPLQDDVVISAKYGRISAETSNKIASLVRSADKKLFIPHQYEWITDRGVKLVKVVPSNLPIIPSAVIPVKNGYRADSVLARENYKPRSAVKVFYDLSEGLAIEKDIDGLYISGEKVFDLNKARESFDDLVFKIVESARTFPAKPILFKLADKSEGMGKVRGTLRLIHQKSLFTPQVEAVNFARHKKGLTSVHVIIPFVRNVNELLQIKRDLAVAKLTRKASLGIWLEAAVPENIIHIEKYLAEGIDGVVLNLDELIAHLNGFDPMEENLSFYKSEADSLIIFITEAVKTLHKAKIPFIAYGTLALYPKVLEFLVEIGADGVVVEKYEVHSIRDLLYQTEKRIILRKFKS